MDQLKISYAGLLRCTTEMVQVCQRIQLQSLAEVEIYTGAIELEEMVEVIGSLLEMEGVSKVG